MNYFELHIGDYVEATGHLSFVEDAAYSRLLRKYYATERPLPADLKAVQRLVGARTKEEREAVAIVLEEFFDLRDDGWHNDRCDEEIAKYQAAEPERAAKRENDKERQQRARARRAALFETLRGHDIIPPYNTSTSELQALVSRVSSQPVTRDVTPPVTRDNTATHFPIPNTQYPKEQEPLSQGVDLQPVQTDAGRACQLLRQAGCARVNPSNPNLLAALREGVTPETLRDTYAEFPNVSNPFAYAVATARSRHAEGARQIATGPPLATRAPQISKTGMALQALEGMKSENRLGNGRDSDGSAEAGLPQLGPSAGG